MAKTLTKTAALVVHQQDPFNGEAPLERLPDDFITPEALFFVRSHGPVPVIEPASYRLQVTGRVSTPLSLSLDDVRQRFPRRTVAAALECAGNRRQELLSVAAIPGELSWNAGAIGMAEWAGAALCDVLEEAGLAAEAGHVALTGLDRVAVPGQLTPFGGSIPLAKARGREVLVAYEMNGQPLSPVHGFPLRAVVPGFIGARSVKWLGEIAVQRDPSANHFQARAYHLREATGDAPGVSLGAVNLNCVICRPRPGEAVAGRTVRVEGYAIGAGGTPVERVEVAADGGRDWHAATLIGAPAQSWAWRLWRLDIDVPPTATELTARAWDATGRAQPERLSDAWNRHGYANNAWHRVPLRT